MCKMWIIICIVLIINIIYILVQDYYINMLEKEIEDLKNN